MTPFFRSTGDGREVPSLSPFFLSRIGTITINNIDNESDPKIIHRLKVESMDVYFKYV
jgi:hypothetical protein